MQKLAVGMTAVALLTACATGSPLTSPGPSAQVVTPELEHSCEDVDLRAPDGQIVFLTGRWIGSGDPNAIPRPSVYYLRQSNDCVVWVGLSAEEGEALGESWIESFSGHLRPNLTIAGIWDELRDGGRGGITVGLAFVEAGGVQEVELVLADSTGDIHPIKRWIREDTSH